MSNNFNNPLDLDSNERKILLSLSIPGTLAEISKRMNTPRSTVEYNLGKLQSKNLINFSLRGKRKYYSLVIKKEGQVNISPSPIIKLGPMTLYTGRKSIEMLWQEISGQPIGSRLVGIQPRRSFNEAIKKSSKHIVTTVSQEITDRRFIVDCIVHEDQAKSIFSQYKNEEAKSIAKAFTGRLEDMVKVNSNFLDEKSEMFIIGKFAVLIDWFEEVAIKIENPNINHFLGALYQSTKPYGKRHEQGKYIESLIEEK